MTALHDDDPVLRPAGAAARVLLIDDHALVRDGMRMHLSLQSGLEVVGEADDGEAALAWLAHAGPAGLPELVITDIGMRGMGGIALAGALHDQYPEVAVLIVSMHDNLEYVRQAMRAGARGYVLKDAPASEIVAAIDAVSAGGTFLSPAVSKRLFRNQQPRPLLTPRESEILSALGRGESSKQIARNLGLSVRTVEAHRQSIKRRLGIDGQAELIKYAVEHARELGT